MFFPQLSSLGIFSIMSRESAQSLAILSNHILQEFPNLESLDLSNSYGHREGQPRVLSTLSYTDLQPIFRMKQLQYFTLYWPNALTGTDNDFKSLFKSRPPTSKKFRELDLNAYRGLYELEIEVLPTYHVLPFLAEHSSCSSLTRLKLRLDFSSFSQLTTTTTSATIFRPFPNLNYIDFGDSIVPEDESISIQFAEWVASMLLASCRIESRYDDRDA